LNIIFDSLVLALAARTGNRSGVYRYTTELIKALKGMPDIKVKLACSDLRQSPWAWYEMLNIRSSSASQVGSWAHFFDIRKPTQPHGVSTVAQENNTLSLLLRQARALVQRKMEGSSTASSVGFRLRAGSTKQPSIIHVPFHLLPSSLTGIDNVKIVRTVHDMLPLSMPHFFLPKSVDRFREAIQNISPSEHIICVSNAVRNELLSCCQNIKPNQVSVTQLAGQIHSEYVGDSEDWQLFLDHYGIQSEEHLILALGTLEPRKNLVTLIDAIEHLYRHTYLRIRLLVVGRIGWNCAEILARIDSSICRDQILLLGALPDPLVNCLYQRSELSVFVSWGEGFGLPVLESMRWGTPVVASNIPVLQEIGGDAAIYVNPASPSEIAGAIQEILENHALGNRLSMLGKLRSADYSWQKTANMTRRCYKNIFASEW
jgi:glycosyltransferase involved in cell wall biosynthesis